MRLIFPISFSLSSSKCDTAGGEFSEFRVGSHVKHLTVACSVWTVVLLKLNKYKIYKCDAQVDHNNIWKYYFCSRDGGISQKMF